jgi:hypothetical protein
MNMATEVASDIAKNEIRNITKQMVRHLFSQYLNTSDQPIGFSWSTFPERMSAFCEDYFIKSFDMRTQDQISQILSIIQLAAHQEAIRIMNDYGINKLPKKTVGNEIDLLNSIFFDATVSFLNQSYHKYYFSKFFEFNTGKKAPNLNQYLAHNREVLTQKAIKRVMKHVDLFNIDELDTRLLVNKTRNYYASNFK